jgi:hypothetical protein
MVFHTSHVHSSLTFLSILATVSQFIGKPSKRGFELLWEGLRPLLFPLRDYGAKMAASQMVLQNLDHAPSWPRIHKELFLLFCDLRDDPRYSERVKHIEELLGDPHFPKTEQIYFVLS